MINTGLYGAGADLSFGVGVIWLACDNEGIGNAVSYPFTVPPVPEASVSVGWTNGMVGVEWVGRWLEGSADGTGWTRLTNAPQPLLVSPTNTQQFFRAVK
jgi:hypothetical protein